MLWTEIVDNGRNNLKPQIKEKLLISYQLNYTKHNKIEQKSLNKKIKMNWKVSAISFKTCFKKVNNKIAKTTILQFRKRFSS